MEGNVIRKLDVVKSPEDSRDWKAEQLLGAVPYPETLDMRTESQPIRNQGGQGSCAAMAGAAMKEVQEFRDSRISAYFSPQFIYNQRVNQTTEGMTMRDLMSILAKKGDCLENTYQYGWNLIDHPMTYEILSEANKYRIDGYASITTIEGLKTALATNGPAVIAVPVYNFGSKENNYRIWEQGTNENIIGGHAMCVVGYTKKGFIIRNSWGEGWGNDGYTEFPFTDWGKQWEFWTTIDMKNIVPTKKVKKSILSQILDWLKRVFT